MDKTQGEKPENFWAQGSARLLDTPAISRAIKNLTAGHPDMAAAYARTGALDWRVQDPGFPGLCAIVVSQQISTAAATRILSRLRDASPDLDPHDFLRRPPDAWRALGLSAQKLDTCRSLAAAIAQGELSPERFPDRDDEDIAAALTAFKGMGPWSAHMYLMFCLARPDIWPAGDMGVQKGVQVICNLPERPNAKATAALGAAWAPYRTAAALIAWRVRASGIDS